MNPSTRDNSLPPDSAVPRRRRWRWSTIFGVLVLVLIVTLAAGWIGFGVWARHRLDTQLAAIRDAGEPMTWRELSGPVTTTEAGREYIAAFQRMVEIDEFMKIDLLGYKLGPGSEEFEGYYVEEYMDSWAPVDESDTAAAPEDENWQLVDPSTGEYRVVEFIDPSHTLDFEEDRERMDAFPDSPLDSMLLRFGKDRDNKRRITAEDIARAADMVRAYSPVLERLRRAASMEPCMLDLSEGPWDEVPELALARRSANLLLLDGLVHIHSNALDKAADNAIAIFRISRVFQKQRGMMVHLVDRALVSLGFMLLSEMLSFGLPDEPTLREVQTVLNELYEADQLTRAVMSDRIWAHTMVDDTRTSGNNSVVGNLPGPVMNYFEAQYLGDMAKVVAASRHPFPEILDAMRIEPTGLLSGIFLPSTERLPVIEGRFLVNLRGVEAAIAVERHRRDHGSQPENLDQLVPEYLTGVPVDPFSDQPLIYKVTDDGYLIYSVDMNRVDDGGDMKVERNDPPDSGITIRRRR